MAIKLCVMFEMPQEMLWSSNNAKTCISINNSDNNECLDWIKVINNWFLLYIPKPLIL